MKTAEKLETELQEISRRSRSLMDNTVDAMIVLDEKGIITDFNLAAEKVFQASRHARTRFLWHGRDASANVRRRQDGNR